MKDADKLNQAIESLEGDYELIRELGKGATAVVYLLRDHALERDVALKVIRTSFGGDEEAIARLQREARLVAQLMHPNIVKLYGTHRLPDGSFALLMEHVPGRNLKEVLRAEGAFPPQRVISVLADISSALAYAHRRRIVHRDVKPENIYIDEEVGAARLADFGVARPWDQDARLTLPGASLGTPAYMSPEQIDGLEVDGRTDVYSLGLVGYEMLKGQHPWEGENVFTIIYRQKNEHVPVEALDLDDFPALAQVLGKALEKDPNKRFESAVAFQRELVEAGGGSWEGSHGSEGSLAPEAGQSPDSRLDEPDGRSDTLPAPPNSDATLAPVDWAHVEDAKEEDKGKSLFGADPKRRWGIWAAALALVLVAGSVGGYKWWPRNNPPPVSNEPLSTTSTRSPALPGPSEDTPSPSPGNNGPARLEVLGAIEDQGTVGTPVPLQAKAVSADGSPMVDTLVTFRVEDGIGILEVEEARTNEEGVAEATLRLPNRPGPTEVTAWVEGAEGLTTRFLRIALPGQPRRVASIAGDGQTTDPGEPLPDALGVRVLDEFGNRIPGIEVRFQIIQGDGNVAPASAQTDEAGRAFARWTLGPAEGTQLLAARVPGADDALVTFQATGRPAPQPVVQPEPEVEEPVRRPTLRSGSIMVVARTFSVGGSQACHLVGGRAVCRGADDRGQVGDGSQEGLAALATGVSHTCGLDVTGSAWCWGANESGQLGDGTTTDRRPAVQVDTDVPFSLLVAGLSHTCGLGPGGQALCWGRNVDGQLGDGTREDHFQPEPVPGEQAFQEMVAGWNHSCGLVAGGQVFCWGLNGDGQLGDGTRVDRLGPTRVASTYQSIVAGAGHTCGISGGQVLCWGDNAFGQIGDGTTQDRPSPVAVPNLPGSPVELAAGAVHTCALMADRSAFCWGQNLHGQLGDGTNQNRTSPVAVSESLSFVSLFAGGGVTCGFTRDGSEYCWGLNQNGQLGDGTRTNRSAPVRAVRRND